MDSSKFRLCLTTPDKTKYDEEASMVIMRAISGDMGIMPGHEPTSAILDYGALRIFNGDDERRMAVFGGIAQVKDNVVTIMANDAEWAEDIDVAIAEAQREQLERRLQESEDDLAIARDQILMRRTLVSIEVSSFPLVSGSSGVSGTTGGNAAKPSSATQEESKE